MSGDFSYARATARLIRGDAASHRGGGGIGFFCPPRVMMITETIGYSEFDFFPCGNVAAVVVDYACVVCVFAKV